VDANCVGGRNIASVNFGGSMPADCSSPDFPDIPFNHRRGTHATWVWV